MVYIPNRFICVYMMQILLRSHYELCKRKKVMKTVNIQLEMKNNEKTHWSILFFSGAVHGLCNNSKKCYARRSALDAQIRQINWVIQIEESEWISYIFPNLSIKFLSFNTGMPQLDCYSSTKLVLVAFMWYLLRSI